MDLVRRDGVAFGLMTRRMKYYYRQQGRSFIKRCTCWKPDCSSCMRSFQARMQTLDTMIRMGWGDTPQPEIPARWRKIPGPALVRTGP